MHDKFHSVHNDTEVPENIPLWDFPGGPVAKIPMQVSWVRFLARELDIPHTTTRSWPCQINK